MRIAVNASIVDALLSGLGVFTVNLLRELAKLHNDLLVYTSCPEVCAESSISYKMVSRWVRPSRGRAGHLTRVFWVQTSLPFRLMKDKASLLLSPLPEGMLLSSIPQVVVVHDVIPLRFPKALPRQNLYFRYLVPILLRKSHAIVAVSESTKRDVITFYGVKPDKIHVVPNGLDTGRYRVGIDSTRVKSKYGLGAYLLYVGNILPHKNLHHLLKAFAPVAAQFPHKLAIAGEKDPRYCPALEAEVKALGLEERVSFLDYVPPAELPALYAGAEAFVLPSLYEGFGLPVLEAMACGTPVITSHAGALPEVAGDAAVLIDPHDIQGMSAAMEAALKDPGMREELRRRGLDQAERYSWRRTALMILELLREAGDR